MTLDVPTGAPNVFGVSFSFDGGEQAAAGHAPEAEVAEDQRPAESLVAIRTAEKIRPARDPEVRRAVDELLANSPLLIGPPAPEHAGALDAAGSQAVTLPGTVLLTTPTGSRVSVQPGGTAVIGRLPDSDILIDDPAVSRRHCCLSVRSEVVVVRDLGSANGTWVNRSGTRIPAPAALDVFMVDNDWLFSGDLPLVHVAIVGSPS